MPVTDRQVEAWLHEDLGHHDVTNHVPGHAEGRLVATDPGVAAGLDAAAAVFEYLGCTAMREVDGGDRVDPGEVVLAVAGPTREILRGKRVAVNLAAHASGIATETWTAVEAAREANEDVTVAATRATTPGLRGVEKRAVAAGGGDTGRLDASHVAVVADAHVAELGLADAVAHVRGRASFATEVAVDVESPEQAERAVEAGADAVRFTDLPPEEVAVGVAAVPGDVVTEISGGITHGNVRTYAQTGVDVISMAWLTRSAPALEYSLRTS